MGSSNSQLPTFSKVYKYTFSGPLPFPEGVQEIPSIF